MARAERVKAECKVTNSLVNLFFGFSYERLEWNSHCKAEMLIHPSNVPGRNKLHFPYHEPINQTNEHYDLIHLIRLIPETSSSSISFLILIHVNIFFSYPLTIAFTNIHPNPVMSRIRNHLAVDSRATAQVQNQTGDWVVGGRLKARGLEVAISVWYLWYVSLYYTWQLPYHYNTKWGITNRDIRNSLSNKHLFLRIQLVLEVQVFGLH